VHNYNKTTNAINLQAPGLPTFPSSCLFLRYLISHPLRCFHNRDKLLYTSLHNQFGKSIEWLCFPVMHTRFALGPAEYWLEFHPLVCLSGLEQLIKVYKRQYLEWVLLYTFSQVKIYFHWKFSVFWGWHPGPWPKFNVTVKVSCYTLPHRDVAMSVACIRLVSTDAKIPPGNAGHTNSERPGCQNCRIAVLTTKMLRGDSHRLAATYIQSKLAPVQSLPKSNKCYTLKKPT
jgi:hypothetical protein